jgi:hypothetical protein
MPKIKVFRNGKGANIETSFESDGTHFKITRIGKGCFLKTDFATVSDAENYCRKELKKNRADVFYLLNGDLLEGTVLDGKFHEDKQRRTEMVFGVLSVIFFSLVGLSMSLSCFPNHPIWGHVVFTLGIGAFYTGLHLFMGKGNFEGAVAMIMLLILIGVLIEGIQKIQDRNHLINQTVNGSQSK